MKKLSIKPLMAAMAIAGAASFAAAPAAHAEASVTANLGGVTNYVFRGFDQTGGLSMQGGIDYQNDMGIYAGIWGSTMGADQNEYDLYIGWAGKISDFDFGVGYTAYSYSEEVGDSDFQAFEEVNLSVGVSMLSFNLDLGKDNTGADELDYNHYAASVDLDPYITGVSLTYGTTVYEDDDFEDGASYFDIAYGTTLDYGLDFTANLIFSGENAEDDTYFVVGLSKSFDLM